MDRHHALFRSIKSGDTPGVRGLIRNIECSARNTIEEDGIPLLNIAAKYQKLNIMIILIKFGVSKWIENEASTYFFVKTLERIVWRDFARKLARLTL
jgi:hypothetical protein